MGDIQFAPIVPKPVVPPHVPEWLLAIGRFLGRLLAPVGRVLHDLFALRAPGLQTVLIALAVLGLAWIGWSVALPLWRNRRSRPRLTEPEWTPGRDTALALLEDADRLAAAGHFAEAAHLLLQRSVGHIAAARPEWLAPSSTAREIGAIRALPQRARHAFATIAREVERSRFAQASLAQADWQRARDAYADFALADLRAAS
ncbi:hypothetical protein [Novosphingobium lentum]|uniref:hypothetical protein n=1 Tax=Novosphingobium lentum TaxID=145287 RepID=UPI000A9A45A7|nr:hypothetical protein [Novosphingobium lentum]